MELILALNPDLDRLGLLYDLSQDSSKQAIADAKAFCDAKGIQYIEKNGTTTAEVQMAAEALIAAGVKAVFTPTDNTIMTAELSIYETFIQAGVQHYTGADSFALNGALVGYGVDYVQLGRLPLRWRRSCCVTARPPQSCRIRPLTAASQSSTPRPAPLWGWIWKR